MEPNQFETYVLAVPRTRSNLSSSNNQEVIVIPDVESQNRVQEDGSNKRRRTEEEGEAAAASHSKDINEPLVCPICIDIWTSRRRTSHLVQSQSPLLTLIYILSPCVLIGYVMLL